MGLNCPSSKKGGCLQTVSYYIEKMFKILNTLIVFLMLSTNAYSAAGAQSDGGNEGNVSKYGRAFKLFLQSNKEKPNDPDTLNYLGFSSRKLGNFIEAEKYYLSGLRIKPNHKRINQYLGELYLNTDRKDKAIEQLNILKSCNCKEYDQLNNLIEGKIVSKY